MLIYQQMEQNVQIHDMFLKSRRKLQYRSPTCKPSKHKELFCICSALSLLNFLRGSELITYLLNLRNYSYRLIIF